MCSRLWYDINIPGHTYLDSWPEPSLRIVISVTNSPASLVLTILFVQQNTVETTTDITKCTTQKNMPIANIGEISAAVQTKFHKFTGTCFTLPLDVY